MKAFFGWIKDQIDWVKSFFMETQIDGSSKGSMKRLVSFMVAFTFLNSYGYVMEKKLDAIKNIGDFVFPDIPPMWATMLGFIIGLGIMSNFINNKNGDKQNENA